MAISKLPSAAFASGSVGTTQLADGAVTTEKLVADVNFRNIIINGDMSIAQRGTSFTGLGNGDLNTYTLDRFAFGEGGAPTGECTISQDTDVPTGEGFASSLKVDVTTAEASVSANNLYYLMQKVEAQNLQYLSYGTSSAKKLTLSFWVKSNVTAGIFGANLYNNDATKIVNLTYSISSANTWEKKTFTIDGDTASGFDNDVGIGLYVTWIFASGTNWTGGVGSTSWHTYTTPTPGNWATGHTANLFSSASNEWYITGVQLEAGTSASDFEFLPYDVNLRRCQRYYFETPNSLGGYAESGGLGAGNVFPVNHPTAMRTTPSVTATVSADDNYTSFNVRTNSSILSAINLEATAGGRVFADYSSMEFDSEL